MVIDGSNDAGTAKRKGEPLQGSPNGITGLEPNIHPHRNY
jgi:hypothetical protein